ncbi:MAG: putative RNA-binding protein with RPS1 domain, partial [Pirellulaceae bacterium]
ELQTRRLRASENKEARNFATHSRLSLREIASAPELQTRRLRASENKEGRNFATHSRLSLREIASAPELQTRRLRASENKEARNFAERKATLRPHLNYKLGDLERQKIK